MHCTVQEDKWNKRQTELDLATSEVGVRNSMLLDIVEKLKAHPTSPFKK